jgi:hypothetical protein
MSGSERLTRTHRRTIPVLLASRTIVEAAQACRVGESTIRRWLADPGFASALRAAARDVKQEAVTALLSAQTEAVATLRKHMRSDNPHVAVRAARAVLELGVKVSEDDLDERIRQLEEEVARWEPGLRLG